MDDLISRQQALETIRTMQTYKLFSGDDMILVDKAEVQKNLMMLQSIQPETNCSEFPNSSDTISRQAAIDALKTDMASLDHIIKGMSAYDVRLDAYVSQRNQVDCDIDTISNLPPAQPERKKGRWIRNDNGTYSCSVCQSWIPEEQHYYAQYCLYCGADMRGEQND